MVGDRQIEVVFYQSATDPTPKQQYLTEEEFATLLLEHEDTPCVYPCVDSGCPHKGGMAWSHGFIPEGKRRQDANVAFCDVLGFDLDHLTPEQLDALCGRIDGLAALIYSTHRHTPEKPRLRLVFFLSRRIEISHYHAVRAAVVEKYGIPEDKKTRNVSRIFFMPTSPRGAPRLAVWNPEGERLDVASLFTGRMLVGQRRQAESPATEEGEVDLKDLRSYLKRYDPDNDYDGSRRALVSRVLRGEPLADKGARDDSVHRVASIAGWLLPIDTPTEAAVELLRSSIVSIPQYEGDGSNENPEGWLQKARRGYEKAHAKKIEEHEQKNRILKAARKKRAALGSPLSEPLASPASPAPPALLATTLAPTMTSAPPAPPAVLPVASPAPPAGGEPDESWRLLLRCRLDRDKRPVVERTGANAEIFLRYHPDWGAAVFRYNVLRNEYEATGGPILPSERTPERVLIAVHNWLALKEGLFLSANEVGAQIDFLARENKYDPIQEYLSGLLWDGVPRIDFWLKVYCGAVVEGATTEEYLTRVGRMWLMAGAARALDPGVKADNVIIFEGPQSAGKSTTLQILGGEWFSDARAGLQSKDTLEIASRSWVIELPELSSMRGSETEAHKAFFSADHDRFRLAYDRRVGDYKRRCILAGSTNDDEYLRDDSGNRRYWPVYCERFDLAALRRDRDQLWAEAVSVYKAAETCPDCALPDRCEKHRWWFTREESERISEFVTLLRLKGEFTEPIRSWFLSREMKDRPTAITMYDVASKILNITNDRLESAKVAIGRALKRLGFDRRRVGSAAHRQWSYETPPGLLAAPKIPLWRRVSLPAKTAASDAPAETEKPTLPN